MKEQEEPPEKELSEMEVSTLLDTKFKTIIIRMLKELRENFNSMKNDIETINKN